MQSTEVINPVSKPKFVNYNLCPWWALEDCGDQAVSITGRVISACQSFIILEMDQEHKKELKVHVRPFELIYTYSHFQYSKIQTLPAYRKLKRILNGQGQEKEQEEVSSPEVNQNQMQEEHEQLEYEIKKQSQTTPKKQEQMENPKQQEQMVGEAELPEMINGQYFKVGSLIEVRGRFVEPKEFVMQQFSLVDNDLDLSFYNHILQIITDKMQSIYY